MGESEGGSPWEGGHDGKAATLEDSRCSIRETSAVGKTRVICCCCSVIPSGLTLQLHGLQHVRLPCPSLSPKATVLQLKKKKKTNFTAVNPRWNN